MSLPAFADGDTFVETAEAPTITTEADLRAFAKAVNDGVTFSGKTVTLMADITLLIDPWTPIGTESNRFQGVFDGKNHTISDLSLDLTGQNVQTAGLFGCVESATITDVNLSNVSITNGNNPSEQATAGYGGRFGAVVGRMYGGTISDCDVTNVTIQDMGHIGGIVGATEANTTIADCDVSGNILLASGSNSGGGWDVGGILGKSNGGSYTITNCTVDGNSAATSKIYSKYASGGILGFTQSGGTISGCGVSNVTVEASSNAHDLSETNRIGAGGIIASLKGTVSNCTVTNVTVKYDDTTTDNAYAALGLIGGVPETHVTPTISNCTATNSIGYWGDTPVSQLWPDREDSSTAASLTLHSASTNNTLEIASVEQLAAFRNAVNAGKNFAGVTVKLTEDIDLTGIAWTPIGNSKRITAASAYKTPTMLTGDPCFAGTFDGDGKTISGLTNTGYTPADDKLDKDGNYVFGLFGVVGDGAVLKNVKLTGVNIDTTTGTAKGDSVGALAGYAFGTVTIDGITVEDATIAGTDGVGAIIGRAYQGKYPNTIKTVTLTNCSATAATVSGTTASGSKISGLFGYVTANSDGTFPIKVVMTGNSFRGTVNNGVYKSPIAVLGTLAFDSPKENFNPANSGNISGNTVDGTPAEKKLSDDGSMVLLTKPKVAQIGSVKYDTLEAAFAAANSAAEAVTINVIADCELASPVTVNATADVTLDLESDLGSYKVTVAKNDATVAGIEVTSSANGGTGYTKNGTPFKTSNACGYTIIQNNGTLTITGNGAIDASAVIDSKYVTSSTNPSCPTLYLINNAGTLTVESADIDLNKAIKSVGIRNSGTANLNGGTVDAWSAVLNDQGGNMTVNGGTYTGWAYYKSGTMPGNPSGEYRYAFAQYGGNSSLTFDGGTVYGIHGALGVSEGDLTVNNGRFESRSADQVNPDGTLNKGTKVVASSVYHALYSAGERGNVQVVINDGTFVSNGGYVLYFGNDNKNGDGGVTAPARAEVKGGTFIQEVAKKKVVNVSSGTAEDTSITGGTYQSTTTGSFGAVPYVAAGHAVVDVTEQNAEVKTWEVGIITNNDFSASSTLSDENQRVYTVNTQVTSTDGEDRELSSYTGREITVTGATVSGISTSIPVTGKTPRGSVALTDIDSDQINTIVQSAMNNSGADISKANSMKFMIVSEANKQTKVDSKVKKDSYEVYPELVVYNDNVALGSVKVSNDQLTEKTYSFSLPVSGDLATEAGGTGSTIKVTHKYTDENNNAKSESQTCVIKYDTSKKTYYVEVYASHFSTFENTLDIPEVQYGLKLDGTVNMSFYVQESIGDEQNHYSSYYDKVRITLPDDTEKIISRDNAETTEVLNGETYMVYSAAVPPRLSAKNVKIELLKGEEVVKLALSNGLPYESCSASVKDYLDAANGNSGEAEDLVDALADYASAARYYFVEDNTLAEHRYSGWNSSPTVSTSAYRGGVFPTGVKGANVYLLLQDKTTIRISFVGTKSGLENLANNGFFRCDYGDKTYEYSRYAAYAAENSLEVTDNVDEFGARNDLLYVDLPAVKAEDLNKQLTLEVFLPDEQHFSLTYGPYNYVSAKQNATNNDKLVNLVKALYWYGETAKTYSESYGTN